VSRLAISHWFGPEKLRLDIGCKRLTLQHGKQVKTSKLPMPMRSGMPSAEGIEALRNALAAPCAQMPAKKRVMEVTLSDALARSWIVERLPGLASPDEIAALADSQMREMYGDAPGNGSEWVIRVDATPFAKCWPAIALPKVLLDLLVEIAGKYDFQLGKIQTRFVHGFNGWRDNPFSRAKAVIFSLDTADGLTIGIRHGDQWQALRTHPPLAMLGVDLTAMLRRECRAVGLNLEDCKAHSLRCRISGKSS
jgi:hypothetical protein